MTLTIVSMQRCLLAGSVACLLAALVPPATAQTTPAPAAGADGAEIAPPVTLTAGKSTLIRIPAAIDRISIGNPAIVDVTLTGTRELYLLGKTFGSSNVMLWRKGGGPVTVLDITVTIDTSALQQQLGAILPGERDIVVRSAADSIVLTGAVSSAVKADQAVSVAEGFARAYARPPVSAGQGIGASVGAPAAATGAALSSATAPKVINLLAVAQPQQVMLEVKVAEVSRSLLDQFGISLSATAKSGAVTYGILTSRLVDVFGSLALTKNSNGSTLTADGKVEDGLVKILAEPNIISTSGQEASFLAGGKVFIPVSRRGNNGEVTITLEEKEFGVGLKFTPVVLDGDTISVRVAPEVSELSRTGTPFVTTNGVTTVLPSFTTRRAQTSVQLRDGQSLAIAGLIKNNVTETVKRFPVLGDLPILGALFRSTEFASDRSELLFLITPRLVRDLPQPARLPTDSFVPPSRSELILNGQLEGSGRANVPPDAPTDNLKLR